MEIQEMKRLYEQGYSTNEIAALAGYKTGKSIADKLKANGIKLCTETRLKKQKTYDENLFETINSDEKAYFLGLLLTDGWTTRGDSIGYSTVDFDLIAYLSCYSGKSIQTVDRSNQTIGPAGTVINRKTEYRLCFTSKKMVKDLERLSVAPNKTLNLQGPNLSPQEMKYISSIIRGIIDGDGTFGFPSNSKKSIYFRIISMSKDFIDWCEWALELLGMRGLKINQCKGGLWRLESGQPENILILLYTVYKHPMGLERKRQKLLEHVLKHY